MGAEEEWALAEQHRLAQAQITLGVAQDVASAWELLDFGRLDATFPRYAERLAATTQARRSVSSALGLAYFSRAREAAGVAGSFDRIAAPRIEPERLLTSLSVTGPGSVKRALANGAGAAEAVASAQSATMGAVRRHVLDGGRESVLRTMQADEKAGGYQRVSDGSPCAFCAMLVSRGAVYKRDTAYFRSHDRCGCTAKPFWELDPRDSAMATELRRLWDASGGKYSGDAALREFRRAYEGRLDGLDLPDGTKKFIQRVKKPSNSDFLPGGSRRLESVSQQIKVSEETIARLEAKAASGTLTASERAGLEYQRARLADLIAERGSLGGVVDEGPSILRTGHYAPEDWPAWARESGLAELLDELPQDRSRIGRMPEGADADTIRIWTDEEALRESWERMAKEYEYDSFDAWKADVEEARAAIPTYEAQIAKWTKEIEDFEAKNGGFATLAFDSEANAELKRLYAIRSKFYDRLDELEGRISDFESAERRLVPGNYRFLTKEMLQREEEAKIRLRPKVEVDDKGLPTGEFARHMDVLDEIGRKVDDEVRARWARENPGSPFPTDYMESWEWWEAEDKRLREAMLKAIDDEDESAMSRLYEETQAHNTARPPIPLDSELQTVARLTQEVIGEIRPLASASRVDEILTPWDGSGTFGVKPRSYGPFSPPDRSLVEMHGEALSVYPDTWVDELTFALGGRRYTLAKGSRGYNLWDNGPAGREMVISGTGPRGLATAVHEIGHAMERSHAHLGRLEFGLLSRRAKRSKGSKEWQKPKRIWKDVADEKHVPSSFRDPYTSKVYGVGGWEEIAALDPDNAQAFEVFTTGTQIAFPRSTNDLKFADAAFRRTILGWLAGL